MPRLFFALQPTPPQQLAMQATASSLVSRSGGRLVPAADLHVTLCFLGEVEARHADLLEAAAQAVPPSLLHFELTHADWWRSSQVLSLIPGPAAHVVPELAALAAQLRAIAAGAGVVPDDKPFRPHVTVARKVASGAIRTARFPVRLDRPLPFTADGFALLRSAGGGNRPRYAVHHAWPYTPQGAEADARQPRGS